MLCQSALTPSSPSLAADSSPVTVKSNQRYGRLQLIQSFHPAQPMNLLRETSKARHSVVTRGSSNFSLIDKITPEYYESDKEQSRKFRKTVISCHILPLRGDFHSAVALRRVGATSLAH